MGEAFYGSLQSQSAEAIVKPPMPFNGSNPQAMAAKLPACILLKGGRHLAYPSKQVPTGNLLLSILDKYDIHQDSIGDSEGRLTDL